MPLTLDHHIINENDIIDIKKLCHLENERIPIEYFYDYLPEANKSNLISYLSLTENSH